MGDTKMEHLADEFPIELLARYILIESRDVYRPRPRPLGQGIKMPSLQRTFVQPRC